MRRSLTIAALAVIAPAAATAQTAGTPAPSASPPAVRGPVRAAECVPRETNLAGIGRASVVAFTGPIFGEHVCATVANVALDAFTAQVVDRSVAAGRDATPAPDPTGQDAAFAEVALADRGAITFALNGATVTAAGPYVVEPGGRFPSFGGDTAASPRVVIAYAGQRLIVAATTSVALVDLARVLRDQPDLFGADAVERAVVVASGPAAALSLHADTGTFGAFAVTSARVLQLTKRT